MTFEVRDSGYFVPSRYYISSKKDGVIYYLSKNLKVTGSCTEDNWFETQAEAENTLSYYNLNMSHYSPAEHFLLQSFDNFDYMEYCPGKVYKHLSFFIFRNNLTGPNVEAVRKIMNALYNYEVVRGTKEFDALASF